MFQASVLYAICVFLQSIERKQSHMIFTRCISILGPRSIPRSSITDLYDKKQQKPPEGKLIINGHTHPRALAFFLTHEQLQFVQVTPKAFEHNSTYKRFYSKRSDFITVIQKSVNVSFIFLPSKVISLYTTARIFLPLLLSRSGCFLGYPKDEWVILSLLCQSMMAKNCHSRIAAQDLICPNKLQGLES